MGTIMYFEGELKDGLHGTSRMAEIGTTGALGNGPQVYLNIGHTSMILDHETASKLCNAFAQVGRYLGYGTDSSE